MPTYPATSLIRLAASAMFLVIITGCDELFAPPPRPQDAEVGEPIPRHQSQPFDKGATTTDPATAANKPSLELTGRVVRVGDGDTVTVQDPSGKSYKVRLVGIDAPELAQPFGNESRQALFKQTRGKQVRVRWQEEDQFGRLLGDVYLGETHLNESQVQNGMAWKYLHAKSATLAAAERNAREKRVGLWARDNPTPPWEYRREHPRDSRR
jgi:endonuclease YncB( thermonuclease family)